MSLTPEVARAVLASINDGKSVKQAAIDNGVGERTIYQWANGQGAPYEGFTQDYARAMAVRADAMAQEILDISDDDSLDIGFDDGGKPFVKGENIQRSKLKVDTRKWLMAKMMPKKYGEKLDIGGQADNPLKGDLSIKVEFIKPNE